MRAFALSICCAAVLAGSAAAQDTTVDPVEATYYYFTPPTVTILFDAKSGVDSHAAYRRVIDTCTLEAQRVPTKQDLVFFTCVERVTKEAGGFFIDGSATIMCGNGGSDPTKNRVCVPLAELPRRPKP